MTYRGTKTQGVFFRGRYAWIRYTDERGQECKESSGQPTVGAAKELLRLRLSEVAERRLFPRRNAARRLFKELFDHWWEHHGQHTKSQFQYLTERVLGRFGNQRATAIGPEDVRAFLSELKVMGLGASSVNHHRTVLNSVFNHAFRWGLFFGDNPVKAVAQETEPPGRERLLRPEEFRSLLAACGSDEELRTFILLATLTALRKGEILQRLWVEVDLEGPVPSLRVPVTKNGRPKTVPLHAILVDALGRLPSYGCSEYLFPSRPTARFPEPRRPYMWDIGKRFQAACKEAKISDFRVHDLRHCGPSILLARGVPDGVVRKLTGHRSRELDRYQHVSLELKQKTVDVIAEELLGVEQNPEH